MLAEVGILVSIPDAWVYSLGNDQPKYGAARKTYVYILVFIPWAAINLSIGQRGNLRFILL